jgi:hypothetical protein
MSCYQAVISNTKLKDLIGKRRLDLADPGKRAITHLLFDNIGIGSWPLARWRGRRAVQDAYRSVGLMARSMAKMVILIKI